MMSISFIHRHNSNLPPSVPEGQEISSNVNQGFTNFGKSYNYIDKLRQNSPSVGSGLSSSMQNMIPNLQNLNPNMQSSPNLTHSGSNVPNLSLNFQNLSPIVNSQTSVQSPNTPQLPDPEFHRLNPQMAMPAQYNGNVQVINYIIMYIYLFLSILILRRTMQLNVQNIETSIII